MIKIAMIILSMFLGFGVATVGGIDNVYAQKKTSNVKKSKSKKRKKRKSRYKRNKAREMSFALRLARARNYEQATKVLYRLSKDKLFRKERPQIKYLLGLMLYEMKLYQGASYQFVGTIQLGNSKYINRALEKLVISASYLEDSRLLNYALSKVEIKKFPKSRWDLLRFRIAEVYERKKDYSNAVKYYEMIRSSSAFYARAKYKSAYISAKIGKPRLAVRKFQNLLESYKDAPVTNDNRVAAVLGLARSYYQANMWDKAVEYYRQVPRDSEAWHEGLFEMSWAQLRTGKFRSVLSNFHTLHSDYYRNDFLPESLLLRGIVYLYICKYDEMAKTLDLFKSIYIPVAKDIRSYLKSKPRSNKIYNDFSVFYNDYENFSQEIDSKKYRLPTMIYKNIYNQGDVQSGVSYVFKLVSEKDRLSELSPEWQNSRVGKNLSRLLEKRIKAAKRRLGLSVRGYLVKYYKEVVRIEEQEEFARFELANSQKDTLRAQILSGQEQTIDNNADRDFYIQNGYEYWPYLGEYWLDEIGNYHYLGKSSCK
ncbi:MAG: tetratricopeptide repeat protein [Bdellovibrionales bacterium]